MEDIKNNSVDWESGRAKSITFIVTKDCQLACKYCYLVGKNSKERMSWEIAKQAIDYILSREDEFKEESVIWDFIGGEPFLEIDLIDSCLLYTSRLSAEWQEESFSILSIFNDGDDGSRY